MDDFFGQPLSPSYGAGFDNLLDFPELGSADPGAAAPKGAKAESQPTAVQQAQVRSPVASWTPYPGPPHQ